MEMTTRATFRAGTYDEATAAATKAFNEFFGDHPWVLTSESAEAETVVLDAAGNTSVVYWAATYEAKVDHR